MWAEEQVNTFVDKEENPELERAVEELRGKGVQRVWLCVEEELMRGTLVRLFVGFLRKKMGEGEWERYFVVRKGIDDYLRQDIGMLNRKVGFVYLVDRECKIRWAGCGDAATAEKEGLVAAVKKVAEAAKNVKA